MNLSAICFLSHVPVRSEASDRSEMVSELIYGETVKIVEEKPKWLRIRSVIDGYEGWVDKFQLRVFQESTTKKCFIDQRFIEIEQGSKHLSFGSVVEETLLGDDHHFENDYEFSIDRLKQYSAYWIDTPYVWGGKSCFGADCSGFVQTLFRAFGVVLPRDSSDQAKHGAEVEFEERRSGDLAFFSTDDQKVSHVGILLDSDEIVHASSMVRADYFTSNGIIRKTDGALSHKLYSLRRPI